MDWSSSSWFWTRKHLDGIHLFHVLVNCHPHDGWIRGLACREYRREGFQYLLHVIQHRPNSVSDRKYDESHCPQRSQNLCYGKFFYSPCHEHMSLMAKWTFTNVNNRKQNKKLISGWINWTIVYYTSIFCPRFFGLNNPLLSWFSIVKDYTNGIDILQFHSRKCRAEQHHVPNIESSRTIFDLDQFLRLGLVQVFAMWILKFYEFW